MGQMRKREGHREQEQGGERKENDLAFVEENVLPVLGFGTKHCSPQGSGRNEAAGKQVERKMSPT